MEAENPARVSSRELKDWEIVLYGALIILIILYIYYYLTNAKKNYALSESWEPGTTDRVWIQYPPHVRVTRTGLKYYNLPYDVNLRQQLRVPILPPIITDSPLVNAMGAVPVVESPPPSQAQVSAYPSDSGAVMMPSLEKVPVSVKTGVPPIYPVIGAEVNISAIEPPKKPPVDLVIKQPGGPPVIVPAASPAAADIIAADQNADSNNINTIINGGNDEVESYY